MSQGKVLITGTGRSGTTFLIKLFSFLEFDTGFSRESYKNSIFSNCNSGMEHGIGSTHNVLKNPNFIRNIEQIITSGNVQIRKVIIPIRDYQQSAQSRCKHKNEAGGLWYAKNLQEQIDFYYKIMAEYLVSMVKYNLNTVFIDFDKMVTDKEYLYFQLLDLMREKDISFPYFSTVYDEVSETSKPKN